MRNYSLYKAFTATTNAGAQVQMIKSGTIVGIQWHVCYDLDVAAETFIVECSLVPIFQATTNDVQGLIAAVSSFAADVVGYDPINVFFPVSVPVQAGQMVYLNGLLTGVNVVNAGAILTVR